MKRTQDLKRDLGLFDAVNISLGAIIGAGIFVIVGAAAGMAGPAVFLSVLIAASVTAMTGITTADLSRIYPKGGGAYRFAREAISEMASFIVGWLWLFSNTVTGATVAIGFGYYCSFFFPSFPANILASLSVLAAIGINLQGISESKTVNNFLVVAKLVVLLFFVAVAVFFFNPSNFSPLAPFGLEGILAGAATIFFAYAGFARVAVMADEIKEPTKTVPKATIISIVISTILYVVVALALIGVIGYEAAAKSKSPLADAINAEGVGFGAAIVVMGALMATGSVVLSSILGLSRLAFEMANDHQLPNVLGKIDKKTCVPRNAIIVSGILMLLLALFADLPHMAYISSFSLLLYYAAINLSGMRILKDKNKLVAIGGFISCLVLMFSLPAQSWLVGFAAILAGAAYYVVAIGR